MYLTKCTFLLYLNDLKYVCTHLYFNCEQTFRKKLFMSNVFCLFENYFDDECNFLYKLYVPLYEIKNLILLLL